MLKNKSALILLSIPFVIVTAYALMTVGYVGIFTYHLPSPAGWQVFNDLCVALLLVMTWMFSDAKRTGRNVWPYIVATLFLGSFGPLAYLLMGSKETSKSSTAFDSPATST